MTAILYLALPLALLFASCYIARLAGGSWGWASWGIFGPLGWIAAFALSGAIRAHEAADRRATSRRAIRRRARRVVRSPS